MVLHLSCGRVGSRLFKVRSQDLTFFCCFSAWKGGGGAAPHLFALPSSCVGACSVKLSCRMTAVMRAGLPEERPDCRAGSVGCGLFPFYFVLNYDGEDVAAAMATEEYKKYGVLYNWYGAMNQENAPGGSADAVPSGVQGICPAGWHLPSKAEWQVLENYVASQLSPVQGNGWYNELDNVWMFDDDCKNVWSALAGKEGWSESSTSQENPDLANGPRDTFGFNGIPAGQCWQTGSFGFSESSATFWTTDMQTQGSGYVVLNNLQYGLEYSKFGTQPQRGYSVRCLKD